MSTTKLIASNFLPLVALAGILACSGSPTVESKRSGTATGPDGGVLPEPDQQPDRPSPDDGFLLDAGDGKPTTTPCAGDAGCVVDPLADAGPACGDGTLNAGEECDDGNSVPGDGCSGACTEEPNFECDVAGQRCTSTVVCGNGTVEGGEVCDDGNDEDGDGCSADCLSKDPNFDCSEPGQDCVNLVVCGDGVVTGAEVCDDGQADGGCSDDCMTIEDGWLCLRSGQPCVVAPRCGDALLSRGEQCDDGNTESDDGCSDTCAAEAGFLCFDVGAECIAEECGDGVRTLSEQCDDGNAASGDGCGECVLEDGWICPTAGQKCLARCGDGQVLGAEQCDDGNNTSGDGCSASCAREGGFECATPGDLCRETVCPDGETEGDEGCDDGNIIAGDGCGPTCQGEPTFTDGIANLTCGDGLITGAETCDDGNSNAGDGCSDECSVEDGYACEELVELPELVHMSVTYRDFKSHGAGTGAHPDFQNPDGRQQGMVGAVCETDNVDACGRLDADGKPVLVAGAGTRAESAESFAAWYRDTNAGGWSVAVVDDQPLTLVQQGMGDVYVFDAPDPGDGTLGFFPINGLGHNTDTDSCAQDADATACCNTGGTCDGRNYHFTTELRYFFQYRGGETLEFRGDDDVWVFINGRLAVDIGGIHCASRGRVVLGDEDSSCSEHDVDTGTACENPGEFAACERSTEEEADGTDDRFGLTKGGVYEIAFFQAERKYSHSSFRLTLSGFLAPRSVCSPVCGDGLVKGAEVCDDGEDNADDTYGACSEDCTERLFCGDGRVDGPEQCDNGFNISAYDAGGDACAPGCEPPPDCGDGVLQPGYEECDEGANNTGAYDGCTQTCELGPYCGDGRIDEDGGEACDDGLQNGGYGKACGVDCQPAPFCGDGERNGPEQCDLGTANNTGEYGGCNADCTLPPGCGDGQPQGDEQCDDGENDGGYGQCAPGCKLGPRCGDSVVQEAFEDCDDGKNDGGYGQCAPGCVLGPRCGDGVVQSAAGEQCDDGNTNDADRCSNTCRKVAVVVK